MSIFSDYKCGALTREEFESECAAMNNRDRWEQAHIYDKCDEYEECWQLGEYKEQDCEECPHKDECSGYEGEGL